MRTYLISSAFLLAALLLGASAADALTVSPTIYELNANPGQTIVKAVRLKNDTDKVQVLQPSSQNFVADPSGKGQPMYTGNQPASSLANWISVDATRVTLRPGESKDVVFTVAVPGNAEPGGHYAALFWGEASAAQAPGANVGVVSQIAAPMVLLNVRGNVEESGQLLNFATKSGLTKFQSLPVEFTAKIANTGNVHWQPQGQVEIMNVFGRKVASIPFNNVTDGGNILPQSAREFGITWDKGFAFGPYTAKLYFVYGKSNKTEMGGVKFWVMPPSLVFVWVVIVLAVLALLLLMLKKMMTPKVSDKKGRR